MTKEEALEIYIAAWETYFATVKQAEAVLGQAWEVYLATIKEIENEPTN